MTWDEIRDLKPEDFPRWPWQAKLGAIGLVLLGLGVSFYMFFIRPLNEQVTQLRGEEEALKTQIREKQKLASNLGAYQAQLREIDRRFQFMLRQLPSQAEIPSLLDDITVAGKSRGLDFELFQPLPEQLKDFSAEVPVKIKVVGDYNAFGNFAAAVAAMPRIVTMQDLNITRIAESPTAGASSQAAGSAKLSMEGTAKTYRYLDDAEIRTQAKAKKEEKK